jgi:hypothetical protein
MDELKKLRQAARRAKLPASVTGTMQSWDAIQDFRLVANPEAILGLLDRLEKAEADAKRLDFIEKNARCDPKMDGQHVWWPTTFNDRLAGSTLRAAIDAQLDKQEKQ